MSPAAPLPLPAPSPARSNRAHRRRGGWRVLVSSVLPFSRDIPGEWAPGLSSARADHPRRDCRQRPRHGAESGTPEREEIGYCQHHGPRRNEPALSVVPSPCGPACAGRAAKAEPGADAGPAAPEGAALMPSRSGEMAAPRARPRSRASGPSSPTCCVVRSSRESCHRARWLG